MNILKLLIFLAPLWFLFGCQSSTKLDSSQSAQRQVARLRPLNIWAARDLNLPAYTLDPKRGTLAPSAQRFSISEGTHFTAFDSGEYTSQEPRRYWIQTELAPPEFIIVTLEDVSVGAFQPVPIEPLYVTKTRGACPLLIPRPTRLAPLHNLPQDTRLFLFYEPTLIGTDETNEEAATSENPPSNYGDYAEPYINVSYVDNNGQSNMAFVSALCLSHPTLQRPSGPPIAVNQLGDASAFTKTLVAQLKLAEPNNLVSSDRERMRQANERCADILGKVELYTDAFAHNAVGDELPTAAVFLCAEKDSSGALTYHMAPTTVGVELSLRQAQSVALLVINLSPPDLSNNTEQTLEFGAYSYYDVHRTSEIIAIPAFDGTFAEIATGVYRVDAGIRNALWVVIESHDESNFNRFQFSSGAFNQSVLNEYYTEQPWWDMSTSVTGQIVHD
jgi:hypothetical protein